VEITSRSSLFLMVDSRSFEICFDSLLSGQARGFFFLFFSESLCHASFYPCVSFFLCFGRRRAFSPCRLPSLYNEPSATQFSYKGILMHPFFHPRLALPLPTKRLFQDRTFPLCGLQAPFTQLLGTTSTFLCEIRLATITHITYCPQ